MDKLKERLNNLGAKAEPTSQAATQSLSAQPVTLTPVSNEDDEEDDEIPEDDGQGGGGPGVAAKPFNAQSDGASVTTTPVTTKPAVNFDNISLDKITAEQIEYADPKLTNEQAIGILSRAHRLNEDNDLYTVMIPRNYEELLLAKISGLDIQFCQNTALDDKKRQSSTIKGNIVDDIVKNNDGTYSVKVQDTYGKYNLKFRFNNDGKTGLVELESGSGAKVAYDENGQTKEVELNPPTAVISYDIIKGKDWATRDNKIAACQRKQ